MKSSILKSDFRRDFVLRVLRFSLVLIIMQAALFLIGGRISADEAAQPKGDWSDLAEEKYKVFGSEKEKKYPINAFVVEKEEWENHYSFMAFWLYKTVDYPKFTSLRIFPFYYNKKSKIDNRESKEVLVPSSLFMERQ